jgi:hypothetical protein
MLIRQARASANLAQGLGPWWLRAARLVFGYDTWSRTERFGLFTISLVLCTLFGWDDGGPFAASVFIAVATVDACLALVAWGARLSRGEPDRPR